LGPGALRPKAAQRAALLRVQCHSLILLRLPRGTWGGPAPGKLISLAGLFQGGINFWARIFLARAKKRRPCEGPGANRLVETTLVEWGKKARIFVSG